MKRYVREEGSKALVDLMSRDLDWVASELARSETRIALCRRGPEGALGSPAQERFASDWDRFLTVWVDVGCLTEAADLGCQLQIRTVDAIHLAAARRLPSDVGFVTFDRRLRDAAVRVGLRVVGF